MEHGFELLPRKNISFWGGYAARSIALSRSQKILFVGCKDGSITAVDIERAVKDEQGADWQLRHPQPGEPSRVGVRAIYDWGAGWLLIGDDLRSLSLVPLEDSGLHEEYRLHVFAASGAPEEFSPITMIDQWNSASSAPEVVVSLRQEDTWVYRIEGNDDPNGAPFRLKQLRRLSGVRAICGTLRAGHGRLLISETGSLWLVVGNDEPVELGTVGTDAPWGRVERPGLISDVAPCSFLHGGRGRAEAYLSTDEGVVRLAFGSGEGPKGFRVQTDKVQLPGFAGMSMAVSQTEWKGRGFLWVSDLKGDVSLFWSPQQRGKSTEALAWRRLGFRLESSQVIRSIATRLQIEGTDILVVGQACRNDRIVVTWYAEKPLSWEETSESFEIARILSRGSWEALNMRRQSAGQSRDEWTPEALLADFYEEAGEHSGELAHFLANPSADLAWSVLERIAEDPYVEGRASEAVLLWTYALIGTIHRRMKGRREQMCLGVIRWLRRLSEQCSRSDQRQREVASAIERAVQHARKWGVFGGSYYERQDTLTPLGALKNALSDYRKFDYIVYCALLFGRRMNLEAEFPGSPLDSSAIDRLETRRMNPDADTPASLRGGPLTPWDIRYLALPSETSRRELVAVSWHGGTEVFERVLSESPPTWRQLWPRTREALLGEEEGEGYSRKIVVGTVQRLGSEKPFLLEAPTKVGSAESFRLWWIGPSPGGFLEAAPRAFLEPGETVYSLLELSPGVILAGIQVGITEKEQLPLLIVRITPKGTLRLLRGKGELPSVYPETRTIESQRNPVLALAMDANSRLGGNCFTVVLGRGDGQILRVSLRVLESDFVLENWEEVGRLRSPIRTLAYSNGSGLQRARVFGGATDGTIVAFQEVATDVDLGNQKGEGQTTFATLWATREDGPIARVHLCRRVKSLESEDLDLVLAVSQKGMAVLFLDSLQVDTFRKQWDEHQRIKVPGERLGRFSLGTTIFGADLLPSNQESAMPVLDEPMMRRPEGMVARLLVATGEGTVRQLTLHYPKYTKSRKDMFEHIQATWRSTLFDPQGALRFSRLRKTESMHAAAPYLPSVYVRWILSPQPTHKSWEARLEKAQTRAEGPARQWLPRHLQALVELDEEWSEGRSLKGRLQKALLGAWKVRDTRLFREILEVTLRRANEELFQQARRLGDWHFDQQFRELMQDLDEMKGAWLGESGELDTKMRIVFAKNLVDGDALWSLAAVLDEEINPLRDAMKARVEQLHRFLAAGDPLLSLETLRAANLAILRACRRLFDSRSPQPELHWNSIQGYFEAVGGFAARVAHSGRGDMSESEAVAHEICRAYALGMLACPSHAFRLSSWMCEADLPSEFGIRVRLQLKLLQILLGTAIPEKPLALFEAVARKLQGLEAEPGTLLTRDQLSWPESALLEESDDLGPDNGQMIQEWTAFDTLLDWLRDLAERLSSEASSINLHEARTHYDTLVQTVGSDYEPEHSRNFWISALAALIGEIEESGYLFGAEHSDVDGPQAPARPDFVLFTARLKRWCIAQRETLRDRRRRYLIFDPQYSMYVRALENLGAAAAGFPRGAALQKNTVLGVLGHSLLELLDEHLLELWEIAQALDPKQTWEEEDREETASQEAASSPSRDQARTPKAAGSRAAEFANYLLSTAQRAELIPKNLRHLQGLLSYVPQDSMLHRDYTLRQLFQDFAWYGKEVVPDCQLQPRSYHFLRLTLRELAQNHHDHGLPSKTPAVVVPSEGLPDVWIKFPYRLENLPRLKEVLHESQNLQRPVRPKQEEHSKSHGAGLYLANLAAAAEGWKLQIENLDTTPGWLSFRLFKVVL